ncbi:integral membrane protein [Mycobacterium tuberculosis T85]|nr:integral membrane protein [Mycobacterium tuberculosis T85]
MEAVNHAGSQHFCCNDYPGRRRRASVEYPVLAEGRADRSAGHRGGGTAAVGTGDRPPRAADPVQRPGRHLDRPISFRPECHGALPHCRCGPRHCRDIPLRAEAATLASDGGAAEAQGGNE